MMCKQALVHFKSELLFCTETRFYMYKYSHFVQRSSYAGTKEMGVAVRPFDEIITSSLYVSTGNHTALII